jgi:hypothetical protein
VAVVLVVVVDEAWAEQVAPLDKDLPVVVLLALLLWVLVEELEVLEVTLKQGVE